MADLHMAKRTGFDSGIITTSQPFNMRQTWNNAAVKFVAHAINITKTDALSTSLLAEWKVDAVVMFQMQQDGFTAFGAHVPKARIHGTGSTIVGCALAAVADGDLNNNEVNFWVNEGGALFNVKVKDSGGVVKSGTIAIS